MGAFIRDHFFGQTPETKELVADLSDDDLWNLKRGVLLQQLIPLAAPDDLDDVPAGTAEERLELLDDLAVAAHRAVQALQVADQAQFNRYLENRGIKDTSEQHVWAFLGDGEMDEPESRGVLQIMRGCG
jgi:pyruvate dehydrogenase complex dehydrogenase (E1) component